MHPAKMLDMRTPDMRWLSGMDFIMFKNRLRDAKTYYQWNQAQDTIAHLRNLLGKLTPCKE